MREQILFSIFLEDTGMKEHVMKLNYPKTFKRIIVLFILLAVIAWLYKSAVNEKIFLVIDFNFNVHRKFLQITKNFSP